MGNWLLALFVCVQIGLLALAWWKLSTEDNAWHTRTNAWASILTVFGIFGTFIGICFGLWGFEVTNIEESIEPLLEGLKLAFLTSVVGIGSSLILKFGSLFQKIGPGAEENPITVLNQIRDSLIEGQGTTHTELQDLKTLVRANHGQLERLVGEFQTFSENVAESVAKLATDELIGALKTVIKEFNTKITEQFGDNFKQLNEAVGRTVKWQKQYREQMDQLASEFRTAAASIEQSRVSLEIIESSSRTIAEQSSSIVACAEKLEPILHTLNDQLEAFSKLRQNALNAFPRIEKQLEALTTKFSDSVKSAIEASKASAESQRNALKEQTEALDNALRQSTQHMINQVEILDEDLKEQLQKALGSLADQLVSLSEKFADDYRPLTEALREVLTIAKGILPVDDNRS